MMFEEMDTAFLQDDSDSSSGHEMSLLRAGFEDLGWQIQSFRRNAMLAGQIPLPREALVAGEVEVVLAASATATK